MAARSSRYRDISVPIQEGMPVWPGDPAVEIGVVCSVARGDGCNVSLYRFGSHTGTHLDAPRHYFDDGDPLDTLPLTLLVGPCFVADLRSAARSIGPADLERAGIPRETERLLLRTVNSALWDDPRHSFRSDFVDLSVDGARWVLDRGIRLVGIDYLSIEGPSDPEFPVHRILLANRVVLLEGLDLRAIDPGPFDLLCLPLRAMNGDGAPARAVLLPPARIPPRRVGS